MVDLAIGEIASSVDWMTMTVKTRAKRDIVERMADDQGARLESDGYERLNYLSHGYTGFRIGGLTYGRRTDDDIVRLASHAAGLGWRSWGKHADNVSRLDLQVTSRDAGDPRPRGRAIYDQITDGQITLKKAKGQSIIENSTGGSTLYVGSRTSETFLRLYDKGAEALCAPPGTLWRWEVELKDSAALAMYTELTRYTSSDIVIAGHVWRIWNERGITPNWTPRLETTRPYVERPLSDDARKLLWLRTQVAPTIAYLEQRGKLLAALDALGVEL